MQTVYNGSDYSHLSLDDVVSPGELLTEEQLGVLLSEIQFSDVLIEITDFSHKPFVLDLSWGSSKETAPWELQITGPLTIKASMFYLNDVKAKIKSLDVPIEVYVSLKNMFCTLKESVFRIREGLK